jgi:hypothetical protein
MNIAGLDRVLDLVASACGIDFDKVFVGGASPMENRNSTCIF